MKHIILSSIHENFHNLNLVILYAKNRNIISGFVLGDLINPGIMHQLGKSGLNLHLVFGNNDGDVFNLTKAASKYENIDLLGEYGAVKVGEKNIFLIHDNVLGRLIVKSETYDLVLCGHNHIFSI
ncbi:MAG: metallophosphoesterase family protein [Patescibacteria group bacterium]